MPSMPLNIMAICSTHNVLKERDIYFLNREIFQIRYFLVAFCVNNIPFLPNDKLLNDDRVMKILKLISYRWNDYKQLEYKHESRKKKKKGAILTDQKSTWQISVKLTGTFVFTKRILEIKAGVGMCAMFLSQFLFERKKQNMTTCSVRNS